MKRAACGYAGRGVRSSVQLRRPFNKGEARTRGRLQRRSGSNTACNREQPRWTLGLRVALGSSVVDEDEMVSPGLGGSPIVH